VHLRSPLQDSAAQDSQSPAKVGFVTNKAVGNAVVRNRVRRRLRHVMGARLSALPDGALVVVRALPASAGASSAALAADLDCALLRLGVGS
jgi:ribonuclease P protein component